MKRLPGLMVLVFLAASPAQAAPITVSAGNTLLSNFDLTGQTPPSPYGTVGIETGLVIDSFSELVDVGTWTVWGDLNATGPLLNTFASPGMVASVFFGAPELSDGIFSARLIMTSGSIVIDPCGFGRSESGASVTPCVAASITVPEPMTLSLMAAGLAGILLRRHHLS